MSSTNAERPSIRGLGEIRSGYGVTLGPTKTRDRPPLLQPAHGEAFFSLQLASCGMESKTQPCGQLESIDLLPQAVSRTQLVTRQTRHQQSVPNLFACNVRFAASSRLPRWGQAVPTTTHLHVICFTRGSRLWSTMGS